MFAFIYFSIITLSGNVCAKCPSYNGLAMTPQMGWNSWNTFACNVSERLILGTAEKISDFGLRDLGYKYVVLDDCWSHGRNQNGTLVADPIKFPNGMKYIANQLHANDLLFGMYSSAGEYTCAGYAGSLGHEQDDADFFAKNGVDYLKYDNCYNRGQFGLPETSFKRYKAMSDALNKTDRPILYSLCNWGQDLTFYWGSAISNSWRMSGDITPQFDRPDTRCPCDGDEYNCPYAGFHCSIMNILNKAAPMGQNAGCGGWNDLDMLEVGVGNLTDDEEKVHFSMWALVKSPMIIGADLNNLKASSFSIYSHAPILAINQDPLGIPATRVWRRFLIDAEKNSRHELQFWSGPLDNGDQVIALLNGADRVVTMNASFDEIFLDKSLGSEDLVEVWDVFDLWENRLDDTKASYILEGKDKATGVLYNATKQPYSEGLSNNDEKVFGKKTGTITGNGGVSVNVPAHGIALYRLSPARQHQICQHLPFFPSLMRLNKWEQLVN